MIKSPYIHKAPGKFHGGIHPEEFKTLSNSSPIKRIPNPESVVIPLRQHIGTIGIPVIKKNDKVVCGQLIAKNEKGDVSIHSPVSGEVISIGLKSTGHPSGKPTPAIEIKTENNSEIDLLTKIDNWQESTSEELLLRVQDAGIVGLGGATFPTSIKLAAKEIDTLIVNAMECEPYITCDDRLLQEASDQIIEGAAIAARILDCKKIVFAIEDNKPDAIEKLNSAITDASEKSLYPIELSICVAPTKYPSGGEKQTIELVTGKQVPKGKLPASLGIVLQNVATLHSIYRAVVEAKPLFERVVTLTGDLIQEPGNYWIPFGIKIEDLISRFSIDKSELEGVILGGPMMGQSTNEFKTPVTKSTNCIIFNRRTSNNKSWVLEAQPHNPCIRCSECQQSCPADLLPQQLYWFSQSQQWDALEEQGLFDCIECGACAYVCPSEIPLVQYFRFGKSEVKALIQNQRKSEKAKDRFEFREMRLARAKAERAQKHKKAAEARKKTASQDSNENKKAAINEALERVKKKKAIQETLSETADFENNNSNESKE